MDKFIGKRLDARYEIREIIGVGGMAVVYKAYDCIDDRVVAIKILKEEFVRNSEFLNRFKNESKAIAVLSHPNIVKVTDVSLSQSLNAPSPITAVPSGITTRIADLFFKPVTV